MISSTETRSRMAMDCRSGRVHHFRLFRESRPGRRRRRRTRRCVPELRVDFLLDLRASTEREILRNSAMVHLMETENGVDTFDNLGPGFFAAGQLRPAGASKGVPLSFATEIARSLLHWAFVRLLATQGVNRIDIGGAHGRNETGHQRYDCQERSGTGESHRIPGLQAGRTGCWPHESRTERARFQRPSQPPA